MAQPYVVKTLDGSSPKLEYIAVATAVADGEFVKLDTGAPVLYTSDNANIYGIAEPQSSGTGIFQGTATTYPGAPMGIDLRGTGIMSGEGPTGNASTNDMQLFTRLRATDIVRVVAKENQTPAIGTTVGITGSAGAWVADTGASNKIAVVEKVILAPTAATTGLVDVRFPDASLDA